MKLIKDFTDLAEAIKYIAGINEAYQKEVQEKEDIKNKGVLLKETLDKQSAALTDLNSQVVLLTGTIAGLRNELEASKSDTLKAIEELTELGTKMDLQEKFGKDGIVVVVGGKNYTLIGDVFAYDGSKKTAEQLSKDKPQLEKMVKLGSGALVEITKS
ncbi:outer membrane murein-binding lipoprotein Lpp [Pedobacter sp. UYP24]